MADAKIEVSIGAISFSGEGEQAWLAEQLDKIIAKAPDLIKVAPLPETPGAQGGKPADSIASQTLAAFLQQTSAGKNQVRKFLATSIWLHSKGVARLTVPDVTKALKDSSQSRIGNPADVLARNIKAGHIEKDGKQFFVTQAGKDSVAA